jgi:hypothetical protein
VQRVCVIGSPLWRPGELRTALPRQVVATACDRDGGRNDSGTITWHSSAQQRPPGNSAGDCGIGPFSTEGEK